MKREELAKVLELHEKWLSGEEDGVKAILNNADLRGVNLSFANLNDANLRGASLRGAILDNVEYNDNTSFFALQCPEKGSFTAYKKAGCYVVELFIPKSAKRSSATSRKCRADKAKVVAIYNKDRTKAEIKMVESGYDSNFVYEIGKTVRVENFNEDRWEDCTTGIHFFITFDEAKNY